MTLDDAMAGVERCAVQAHDLADRLHRRSAALRAGAADVDWSSPAAEAMRHASAECGRQAGQAAGELSEAAVQLRTHLGRARERAVALEQAADVARRALGDPLRWPGVVP